MSYSSVATGSRPPGPLGAAKRWGWFVAFGAALVALGIFAWVQVVAVTVAGVVFLGAMMAVAGIFQIINAFLVRGWSGFFLHAAMGVLYIVGGVLMMLEPVAGALVLTIFIAVCLVISGIFRMVLAVTHRSLNGWWLMLFSGLISLLIGLLLYSWLPWSSLFVPGTLIAMELLVQGITWIQFGWMLRKVKALA